MNEITIGGSEIAAVMGMSRWCTTLQLWAEKTGKLEKEDISKKEEVELGTELEDFVAKKFERKSGLKTRITKSTYEHKKYPYLVSHIDRLIEGRSEILECKTCSAWKLKEWEGEEIPTEYVLQVQWYLGITEREKGWIACLIGGQKFVWKEILFDKELYEKMVETAVRFVEYFCKENIPPVAVGDDNKILSSIYEQKKEEAITIDESLNDLIASRELIQEKMKILESDKAQIDARIKQTIGENKLGITSKYKISWTEQKRTFVDIQKLKKEKLYDNYSYEQSTRVLRVSERS